MLGTPLLFLIASLVISAILVLVFRVFFKAQISKLPYLKKESFLSPAEKDFYHVLSAIVGSDYLLFSKTRMSDLLYLPKLSNKDYYHYQNKIQSKHVDFLLCDKESTKPVLAIELDDSSHLKASRISRDSFVDEIFENAQLPILHIRASSSYLSDEISQKIRASLSFYSLPPDDTSSVA